MWIWICSASAVLIAIYIWFLAISKGSPLETFGKFDFTWSNLWKNVVYVILKIIIVSMIARIKLRNSRRYYHCWGMSPIALVSYLQSVSTTSTTTTTLGAFRVSVAPWRPLAKFLLLNWAIESKIFWYQTKCIDESTTMSHECSKLHL